jgi:hypothetical protein
MPKENLFFFSFPSYSLQKPPLMMMNLKTPSPYSPNRAERPMYKGI